jgi:UDP-MurNAc hydroxylase
LEKKLAQLTVRDRVTLPLYFRLGDRERAMLRVDFLANRVEPADVIAEENYYAVSAPSWEVARVLNGRLTWDDFSLTLRLRLNRQPDIYQAVIQAFMTLETEDMNWYCAKLLELEENQERVIVEAGGKRYAINRFCPHQGGDLTEAWIEQDRYLTCPRHRWQFDLEKEGRCLTSSNSVRAVCLEED